MSQGLPIDGVRLVVEGERQFVASLQKVNNAWQATVQGFDSAGQATSKMTMTLGAVEQETKKTGASFASLVTALGAAAQMFDVAIRYVGKAVDAFAKLGKAMFDLAVRSSELQAISMQFAILNQNVEGGSKAMLAAMQEASAGMVSVRDLMTSFNDAAALVNVQFAQRLPEALGLLSKVSAATGTNMNYLLDSLVRGVGRVSPLILDNLKIQVGVAEATQKASEMFGKEADQLTKVEQQTALTELALAKLEAKFGALPDTTQSLAAQTATLQANFQNIGDTLGQYLVPGMTTLVESLNKVVGAFSAAISEGGSLYPLLVRFGAVFSFIADGAASFADKAVKAFEGVTGEMTNSIAESITQALQWGMELIAGFAEGIVRGAASYLTQAMTAISNMLTSWLLGASPPKVAPGIVDWGIKLMEQYLQGMTEADFGILKTVQGPLKKILEGPQFANISKALAGALAGGDREKFLQTLSRATGVFADAVRNLAMAQFDLADAVTAVEVAEDALAKSRERVTQSQAEVNRQTAEYNRLLREGASRAILDAQLEQINAAEENMRVAMDQVGIEEDALQAAKDRQSQLEAEAKLQQDVLDQLLGVNEALTEQEKAKGAGAKGVGKGAGAIPDIAEALGIPTGLDLGGRIGAAIEAMKATIAEKFKDIFKPLSDAWDNIKKDIFNLGQVWDQFKQTVGRAWDALKEKYPILQSVEDWIRNLPRLLADAIPWFRDRLAMGIGAVTAAIIGEGGLLSAWKNLWAFISETFWPYLRDTVWPKLVEFADKVVTPLEGAIRSIGDSFQWWYDKIVQLANEAVTRALEQINKLLDFVTGHSPSPLEKGLKGVNQQLQVLATTRLPSIASMGTQMQRALAPTPMLAPASNMSITNNFGGNSFYGNMGMAEFDARVQQSLRRQLRR